MKLTKDQRRALKRIYDRGPLAIYRRGTYMRTPEEGEPPCTYRQFRRQIVCGWDCVMVAWQGVWLGIETDGYTHS
jgi:hypothetical protein